MTSVCCRSENTITANASSFPHFLLHIFSLQVIKAAVVEKGMHFSCSNQQLVLYSYCEIVDSEASTGFSDQVNLTNPLLWIWKFQCSKQNFLSSTILTVKETFVEKGYDVNGFSID